MRGSLNLDARPYPDPTFLLKYGSVSPFSKIGSGAVSDQITRIHTPGLNLKKVNTKLEKVVLKRELVSNSLNFYTELKAETFRKGNNNNT